MKFNAALPCGDLTRMSLVCFIYKNESRSHSQGPRQTRRRTALHHRDPARLLAPSPHPPSHRLCCLRQRTRPLGLGPHRQLSRRTHQADQPFRRTENHGPALAAQLPQTQSRLGTHLRVEPAAIAPGEESMTRIAAPQLSFADLELRSQGVHLDPVLQGIAGFLDDHATLIEQVRQDLARGLKNPHTGRSGITPAQTLRSLILMRVKNWDYRELRERINDGFTLRGFTDFDSHCVPKHDAFNRAFNRLTPATMQAINQAVVQAAVQLGLEDGKQLRVDTTVVQTDIHYPTDATLLWDTVRTVTRLVDKLHQELPRGVRGFTNRTRSARRRMQALERMSAIPGTRSKSPSTANYSASPGRCWKARARSSRRPPRSRVSTCSATWPSTNSASRSRLTATWARRSLTRPVGGYSTESRFLPTRRCTPSSSPTRT